jgi:hypothetical protein
MFRRVNRLFSELAIVLPFIPFSRPALASRKRGYQPFYDLKARGGSGRRPNLSARPTGVGRTVETCSVRPTPYSFD